jgi:hypothetical protein
MTLYQHLKKRFGKKLENGILTEKDRPQYVIRAPRKPLPEGKVIVHNGVRLARRIGERGSRLLVLPFREGLVVCDCGWAPSLIHYTFKDSLSPEEGPLKGTSATGFPDGAPPPGYSFTVVV